MSVASDVGMGYVGMGYVGMGYVGVGYMVWASPFIVRAIQYRGVQVSRERNLAVMFAWLMRLPILVHQKVCVHYNCHLCCFAPSTNLQISVRFITSATHLEDSKPQHIQDLLFCYFDVLLL